VVRLASIPRVGRKWEGSPAHEHHRLAGEYLTMYPVLFRIGSFEVRQSAEAADRVKPPASVRLGLSCSST